MRRPDLCRARKAKIRTIHPSLRSCFAETYGACEKVLPPYIGIYIGIYVGTSLILTTGTQSKDEMRLIHKSVKIKCNS